MVAFTCNPAVRRLRQEDLEFQVNVGYIARPSVKLSMRHMGWGGERERERERKTEEKVDLS
jgi:hypothetical protein